jgi:hypothetical protein
VILHQHGRGHGTLVSHSTDVGCIFEEVLVKKLLLATVLAFAATQAIAQVSDELPYKEDGPERDYFLRTFVRACMQEPYFLKLASNEKEALQFCECRALYTADVWTHEDDLEFQRSKSSNTKLPAETYDKWRKASISCQTHLSKLPKAPSRAK